MNLKEYFNPLLKWWWLLLLATGLAASSAYFFVRDLPPVYMARTTLMIGRTIMDPNPSGTELGLSQQLTQAYADIAQREPVREAAREALGIPIMPKYDARPIAGTPFLEISVTNTDPRLAQAVVAELANQLVLRSPTSFQQDEQNRQQFVNQQISKIESDISKTEDDITKNQDALGNMNSAVDIARTQDELKALETKLTSLQSIYASMLAGTQQGALNTLSILEPATLPTTPIGPNKLLILLMAATSGFLLAAGASYLIEFLDDSFHSEDDISNLLQVSILGQIPTLHGESSGKYVLDQPLSPIADSFRTLRTNLEYSRVDDNLKTILVTSPDASEGKTTVASNLAAALAQGGKKTILLDADLRKPNIHNLLKVSDRPGLSEIFKDNLEISDFFNPPDGMNVPVITAGAIPPNPSELLGSQKMDKVLSSLKECFDMIVIDGAPFVVADALILAPKVDGVLVVIRPGFTRKGVTRAMMDGLNQVGVKVIGVVMNRVHPRYGNYYSGYNPKYYASVTNSSQSGRLRGMMTSIKGLFFRKPESIDKISQE